MTIASYSRRIAAATTALGRATHAGHASRESLDVVRAAAAAMEELEHAITDERAPSTADLPSTTIVRDPVERAPLERIVGAIEVMRSAVRRGV
jgi:hypothetical protein